MIPLSPEAVLEAARRIEGAVHRTPVLTSSYFDERTGAKLFFKCENFQKIGAFKARGALNAVRSLSDEDARHGVVTHSSGNHGQAVAWAAKLRGISATVIMPDDSTKAKVEAVKGYGARIILCAPGTAAREAATTLVLAETRAALIHPYDDLHVIAGQGTAALEMLADVPQLDVVMTPVGGGGLLSGTVLAVRARQSHAEIFGAEPRAVDDAARSLKSGSIESTSASAHTVADGLRSTSLGLNPFAVIKAGVRDVLTVSEDEIVAAMRLVMERMKIIIEPSSAVPVAAILANSKRFAGRNVGIVLTGGNVDLQRLPWQLSET